MRCWSASFASDIGDRTRQVLRAVHAEAGELRNVYTLSVASVSDMKTIRTALKSYAEAVVSDEWPAMAHDHPSPRTDAAFDDLLREVSNPSIAKSAGNAVHAALLNAAVRLGTARNDRLSIAADHTNDLKWLMVIILGLFTQVGHRIGPSRPHPRVHQPRSVVFSSAAGCRPRHRRAAGIPVLRSIQTLARSHRGGRVPARDASAERILSFFSDPLDFPST